MNTRHEEGNKERKKSPFKPENRKARDKRSNWDKQVSFKSKKVKTSEHVGCGAKRETWLFMVFALILYPLSRLHPPNFAPSFDYCLSTIERDLGK